MEQKQKKPNNVFRIAIIIILILVVYTALSDIYFDTTDNLQIQIGTPTETYTWDEATSFNTIIISEADSYIVFNEIGFNITSTNAINVRIDHIDEDIANPADGDDDLIVFTVTNTPGNTWFNLSGLENTLTYTVKVNDIFFSTEIANSTGEISFNDNPNSDDEYSIYWTSGSNQPPTITSPSPANESTGISVSPTLQATINDAEGNPMTYYIRTNESGVDWYTLKTDTEEPNGTISTTTTGNFTTNYTQYYWSVNCTDTTTAWTNNTFSFTTAGTGTPVVQTNEATNIQEINATLSGTLTNDGGETCTVWFEWDNTTALTDETANQTATSGDSFTVSLLGNLTEWYSTDWVRRRQITINHAYVDSDLKHYPIFLNISGGFGLAQTSGRDILFTAADGLSKLNHELVSFTDKTYVQAWVNITRLYAANDTIIWMYWGNDDCSNQWNVSETWTDFYVGVYHLDEDEYSTVYDSSGNSYDGTYYGDLPNRNVTWNGYGQYLDGDGDYISFPEEAYNLVHANSAGYMAWVKQADERNMPYWFTSSTDDKHKTLTMFHDEGGENDRLGFYGIGNTTAYSSWSSSDDHYCFIDNFDPCSTWWMHLHQWSPSTAYIYAELDGTVMSTATVAEGIPSVETYWYFNFGYDIDTSLPVIQRYYKGYVDEIRIYQELLNSSWIKTDNYNFNEQAGFITVGDTETRYYDTGILSPGQLYYYRAIANNTNYTVYGDVVRFLTRPTEPQLFTALTENQSGIQLTWINGTGDNLTYIERSISSIPWVRGTEYMVYNGSLLIYNDTGLELDNTYYYQAWGYTNWTDNSTTLFQYSRNYDSAYNKTNSAPVFSNVFPVNDSTTDVPANLSLYIYDKDGHTFNWTIETRPDIGNSNHTDDSNGTKTCRINGSHTTNYSWYVNCTDSYDWTNETFTFRYVVDHVDPPTDGVSVYDTTNNRLNLSWTNDARSDYQVVVQRNDTYSTSATQSGNWIRQNASTAYINISWTETSGGYFTIFSYNSTANMYSYNNATPLGLNIPWGALAVNVYNESNSSQGITFNIEISNSDSTDVYYGYEKTNTLYLDLYDIPYGDDTIFVITASGYRERTFYYDLELNNFYNYSFWLPPYTTPSDPGGGDPGGGDDGGGGNVSTTRLYFIQIVNELNQPIADTEIQIRKYINATSQYKNLTILNTDGYGYASAWLIPNSVLRLFVFADGYEDAISEWITDPVYYGLSYPKIIQMEFIDVEPTPPVIEPEEISFTGYIEDDILYLTYLDNTNQTLNTQIYIYEIDSTTGDTSLNYTDSKTSNMSFTISITVNTSNSYVVHLFHNHTTFGGQKRTLTFDAEYISTNSEEKLDSLLDVLIGENMFGWCNLLIFLFLVTSFYYTDEKDASKILIILGGIFLFLNLFFGFASTLFTVAGGVIPTLFIVVGVITAWNDYRKTRGIIG